jgi:4-hydroxybenzoate polyprenyltransferase
MLVENLFLFIRHNPLLIFKLFFWLLRGKAYFKKKLADAQLPEVNILPYNYTLIDWLRMQRSEGAKIILATASDIRIAHSIANHLGLFDDVIGTELINLSSHRKRSVLVDKFGERGYEYIGNSNADLPVWKSAAVVHVANPGCGVLRKALKIGNIGMIFDERPGYFRALVKALRIHQWAKNMLIFVPLLASHKVFELTLALNGLLAFIAFGVCASSVYILNDLIDLPEDRLHPTKRNRPLAAGKIPILHTLYFIPGLLVSAFGLALWLLPWQFAVVLLAYYLLTLTYSIWFKRVVMLGVVTLAMLYTARVIAGAAAMSLVTTFWILAFCMFIFLSLAFLKRYTELHDARLNGKKIQLAGRGYYASDFELLASLGSASGYLSVLVLALYIQQSTMSMLYRSPEWMWGACPLLLFWLSRAWLLAHRGQMHDDPIVFALRDKVSRRTGYSFLLMFILATI